jgi:glycerol-3-phosphate dehydrogenase
VKKHHVVVIGGGGTGAAIAYDLVKRGFDATVLERGELTSGTTGRHHGQLHCGARYAVADREIARECMEETNTLRKIASESLESNYGLFVALNDDDEEFAPTFINACLESGIPAEKVPRERAFQMEPKLSEKIGTVVQVPDGTIDAWRLPLQFFAGAQEGGAVIRPFCPVTGVDIESGRAVAVRIRDLIQQHDERIEADLIVNATGAWASQITKFAGIDIPITPAPGTMLAVRKRLCNMVISHLHPSGDGDIIVPQRGLSIIGTTQYKTEDPDDIKVPREDVDFLYRCADEMIPDFSKQPFHAAWIAARPLAGKSDSIEDGRGLSRDFVCVNHGRHENVHGLLSVIGGKATVLRAMAEKTVDAVCHELGVQEPCTTTEAPLPSHRKYYRKGAK